MQTAAGNPQQNYAAGYTYSYQAKGYSQVNTQETTFNVQLLAGGALVSGTQVTGNNYTTGGGVGPEPDSNVINGSLQVDSGSALVGQQIGMRLNSNGPQTKFLPDGENNLSALLTNHAGFDGGNGEGALYSTSFSGGAQVTAFDHVLDMSLTNAGGAIVNDYFRINNVNDGQNTVSFGSETDTFRAGTSYQISIDANKAIESDPAQNSIDIVMGGGAYTETITMSATRDTYTFTVDADDESLAGEAFSFQILASSLTSTETANQYHIYEFEVTAIPEANSFALLAGSLALASVMIRRRA